MKINGIVLENFRQFYGNVSIDLTPNNDKNIILIGGENGHGKTNFLLGIVWGLYGKLITKVDDSFKAEIANNYPKFLDGILNKDKKLEECKNFSIELVFSDVSYGDNDQKSTIIVKRSYNIESQKEELTITSNDGDLLLVSSTEEERQNFINDYLVPIEIARFVFFDAEKISQIADLTTAQQAKLMNKTLGNMLGLNIYQNLLDEITSYIRGLKKDSSTHEIQTQITNLLNVNTLSKQDIESKNTNLQKKNQEKAILTDEIEALEIQINRKGGDNTDIKILQKERNGLEKQRDEMQQKFSKIADIIPLLMLSGLMQESKEHIEIEQINKAGELSKQGFSEKMDSFIEELFNKGKIPDPDITLKQKMFYEEKSTKLSNLLADNNENNADSLPFLHDLDLSKINDLKDNYKKIQSQSNNDFNIIEIFSKKKEELHKLEQKIRKIELNSADELTKSLMADKNTAQNSKDDLIRGVGGIENDISRLESDIFTNEKRLLNLYNQSKINKKNQAKIELSEKYIEALEDFIKAEKEEKKEAIKNKLLLELKSLWHKRLVNNARLTILPNDKGLEVELLDKNNNPIDSKGLSKGEQQIYVSALLKAILDSSIHNLPVFIDTPLARLDSEHRGNILKHYYPNLSAQVVVFSTDTEITPEKLTEIEKNIAKSYLITNTDGKSNVSEGYFN